MKENNEANKDGAGTGVVLERIVMPIYKPIGSIVLDRVYSEIDKVLDELGVDHDEFTAQIIVNSICNNGIEICITSEA